MLESVKEVLSKDIEFEGVKKVLTKEIDTAEIHDFLEMEVEITRLKELLATEIKLKEFLLQEVDFNRIFKSEKIEISKPQQSENEISKPVQSENEISHQESETIEDSEFVDVEVDIEEIREATFNAPLLEIKNKAPVRKLPVYDLGLLETLRNEQKEILFIYGEIMKFANEKKHRLASDQLAMFRSRVASHFQMSDKELYSYLKAFIHQKYPNREKAFTELSLEMKNISISIFYTLTQSPNVPLNELTHDGFIKEFDLLGEQLQDRFGREKRVLFPMYEKSRELKDISSEDY